MEYPEAGAGAERSRDPLSESQETELAFQNIEPQDLYWVLV